jgi:hypothetical protein
MNSTLLRTSKKRVYVSVIVAMCLTVFCVQNQALAAGSPGDVNGDGVVNINDLQIITTNFGKTTADPDIDIRADINGDEAVNNTDLSIVIRAFAQEGDTNITLIADKENITVGDTVTVTVELAEAAQFSSWQTWLSFASNDNALALENQSGGSFTTFVPDSRSLLSINSSSEVRAGGFSLSNNEGGSGTLGIFTFKAMSNFPEGSNIPSVVEIYTENKSANNPFGAVFSDITGVEFVPTLSVGTISINIWPANTAPTVSAGNDQTIRLPNTVTLEGSVVDDALPEPPGETTINWTKVTGPGTVTFEDATTESTVTSFSQEGTYTLRLSATDSELESSDDVTITVDPVPDVYLVTPDRLYVELGEDVSVPVVVKSSNYNLAGIIFDFITSSTQVFGNALFN